MLSTAMLALPTAPAWAEGPADVEEIIVTGRPGSPTAPSPAEVAAEMRQIAGAVDLVPAEAFRDRYALNLRDMLASSPGVFAQQRFAEEVRISIRGSGLSRGFHMRGLMLMLDGLPVNTADGAADFQEIDPATLRHIEVYRGGNALRYGAASLGGAINMVMPTGRTATAPHSLVAEGGSFGTLRTVAGISRAWDGGDAHAYAVRVSADGWRDQSEQRTWRVGGNIAFTPADGVETRFYIAANDIAQNLPGTLTLRAALEDPKQATPINLVNDYSRDIRSLRLANRTAISLGDARILAGVDLALKDLYHPIFQVVDQDSSTYGGHVRVDLPWALGGMSQELTAGANLRAGRTDARLFLNQGGRRGRQTSDTDQRAWNVEAYLENRSRLTPELSLVLGAQMLWAERETDDLFAPARSDSADYDAVSPKAGLLWDVTDTIQAWANVTRAVEPPTFSELNQTPVVRFVPLDAQKAWTAEAGTRGRSGGLSWDVTFYRAWVEDELLAFTIDPGLSIPAATFNAGDTIHQGIEAGAEATLATGLLTADDRVRATAVYALNDFYFVDDPVYGDRDLAGIPRHQLRTELRYEVAERYRVNLTMEWVPQGGWIDYANTLRAPGYTVFGLGGSVRLAEGVSLYGDVRNLFDRAHVTNWSTIARAAGTNPAVFYPGEPLSAYAGLRVEF
jgi:iron complex outermembrane receptor protein